MPEPVQPEIHQRLLELAYGLLDDDEAAELRAQVSADPAVAEAQAHVARAAELFSAAARLESAPVVLAPPAAEEAVLDKVDGPRRAAGRQAPWYRWAPWMVGTAAVVLLAVAATGFVYHQTRMKPVAAEHLRLRIAGPPVLVRDARNVFSIATTSVTGEPVRANVKFSLLGEDGSRLFAHSEGTDERGLLRVTIGAAVELPRRSTVEVAAVSDSASQTTRLAFSAAELPPLGRLALDRPAYRAGDTLRAQFTLLAARTLHPVGAARVEFRVEGGSGNTAGMTAHGETHGGMATAQLTLDQPLAEGQYELVAASAAGRFAAVRRGFSVIGDGEEARQASSKKEADAESPAGGKRSRLDVEFYPEGGQLAAGLENRVYFTARDERGQAASLRGRIVDNQGQPLVRVETARDGMGLFAFSPALDEKYRLEIDGSDDAVELPPPSTVEVALNTGRGVFAGDEPLEFNVRAAVPGLPLAAVATCRGVVVGHEVFVAHQRANSVSVPLDREAKGAIRLAIFDYQKSPPRRLAERLVYRRPQQSLEIEAEPVKAKSPGRVAINLSVSDGQGKPLGAILSVAGFDARQPLPDPSAEAYFLLAAELGAPLPAKLDSYLESGGSDAALDLFLGTGGPDFADRRHAPRDAGAPRSTAEAVPLAVADNLASLQAQFTEELEASRTRRTAVSNALTTLSFFGGLALVLMVAMLNLLGVVSGVRVWGPSLGVALASVAVAMVMMNPQSLRWGDAPAIAFAPYSREVGGKESKHLSAAANAVARTAVREEAGAAAEGLKPAATLQDQKDEMTVGAAAPEPSAAPSAAPAAAPAAAAAEAAPAERGGGPAVEQGRLEQFMVGTQRAARAAPASGDADRRATAGAIARTLGVEPKALDSLAGPGAVVWESGLKADNKGGATIVFARPAGAKSIRLRIDAITDAGQLGSRVIDIEL